MRFSLILVSCSLAGGVLGACGGSTTGTGSGPVPESQFATRLVSAVCDNVGGCCKSAGYTYDAAACKAAAQKGLTVGSKYSTYNAQAAGNCIDAIAQAMAACKGLDSFNAAACNQVYTGTRAAGQTCDNDLDCVTPPGGTSYCDNFSGGGGGGGQGTCVVEPRGKKGDACDQTCTQGANSYSCSGGGGGGGTGGSGGSSGGTATCYTNDGLYCSDNGVCATLIPIGQPCPSQDGCVSAAYCDSGTCVARKAAGSPCTSYSDECKDGAYCADPTGSGNGICTNLKADGAACTDFQECQSGDCENGKCTSGGSIVSPQLCSGQGGGGGGGTGGSGAVGGSGATGGAFNGTGGTSGTGGTGGAYGGVGGT